MTSWKDLVRNGSLNVKVSVSPQDILTHMMRQRPRLTLHIIQGSQNFYFTFIFSFETLVLAVSELNVFDLSRGSSTGTAVCVSLEKRVWHVLVH